MAPDELLATSAVDVVVVSYNSREHLRASVEPLVNVPHIRLIVVDNASSEESVSVLDGMPIDVVQLDTNGGFASGCNEGWRRGDAPFVLFLNPDARIDPESLGRLVALLVSDPQAGLVGPKVLYPGGSLHFSLRRFPRVRSTFARALFLHRVLPRSQWTDELVRDEAVYDRPGVAEWISGACMLVRRTLLERLEGLDEGFFLYCEDTDLCKRISDAGYDVRYEPAAFAVHVGGASAPRPALLPVLAWSRLRYAEKHGTPVAAALERFGLMLETFVRLILASRDPSKRSGYTRTLRVLARPVSASRSGRPG